MTSTVQILVTAPNQQLCYMCTTFEYIIAREKDASFFHPFDRAKFSYSVSFTMILHPGPVTLGAPPTFKNTKRPNESGFKPSEPSEDKQSRCAGGPGYPIMPGRWRFGHQRFSTRMAIANIPSDRVCVYESITCQCAKSLPLQLLSFGRWLHLIFIGIYFHA